MEKFIGRYRLERGKSEGDFQEYWKRRGLFMLARHLLTVTDVQIQFAPVSSLAGALETGSSTPGRKETELSSSKPHFRVISSVNSSSEINPVSPGEDPGSVPDWMESGSSTTIHGTTLCSKPACIIEGFGGISGSHCSPSASGSNTRSDSREIPEANPVPSDEKREKVLNSSSFIPISDPDLTDGTNPSSSGPGPDSPWNNSSNEIPATENQTSPADISPKSSSNCALPPFSPSTVPGSFANEGAEMPNPGQYSSLHPNPDSSWIFRIQTGYSTFENTFTPGKEFVAGRVDFSKVPSTLEIDAGAGGGGCRLVLLENGVAVCQFQVVVVVEERVAGQGTTSIFLEEMELGCQEGRFPCVCYYRKLDKHD